jgi:hypothetical protein
MSTNANANARGTTASSYGTNFPKPINANAQAQKVNASGSDGRNYTSIIIQVVLGLVASYLIYIIALAIMKVDKLVIDERYDVVKKRGITVIDGFIDASMQNVKFNTSMPMANNYMPIRPSVNIKGGAQFSYCFWMNVDASAVGNVANKVILLKGDAKPYEFTVIDKSLKDKPITYTRREPMVFCPMIKFGKNEKSFDVAFNTLNRYDEVLKVTDVKSKDSNYRSNLLATLTGTWYMITVTFEDNIPINEFENGVQVKFYINDVMYQMGKFRSALKQNNGDLQLFPGESPLSGVKVSNLKYYNYVLSEKEISSLAMGGANLTSSSVYMSSMTNKPPVLSDYNKLDIYNL